MSAVDWMQQTRQQFAAEPAPVAARHATREFVSGVRRRLLWLRLQALGEHTVETDITGVSATFFATNRFDVERAKTLNREAPVARWLFDAVGEGTVFWDVGAYHGHYSVLAARHGADVVAFEPYSPNRVRMLRNIRLNYPSRFRKAYFDSGVVDCGLDDTPITLYEAALSDTGGVKSFDGVGVGSELSINAGGADEVHTVRGDDIDPWPDVAKIDVEGHELAVLDGMVEALKNVERIAVEVHDGVEYRDVAARLEDAGLRVRELSSSRSQPYIGGER